MKIITRRSDIIWNYIGTFMSMASGFLLLPLLMRYLSSDELGLWYVYVAIANLAVLFEFGFNPTFARNIVYVVSGARELSAEGCSPDSMQSGVDWHLLNVVIRSSKLVYAALACFVFLLLVLVGTPYVAYITKEMGDQRAVWVSWILFSVAMVFNLYFLYSITVLRGYGDIAGENRAKTFAKLLQLVVSVVLLLCGAGFIGASFGYMINAVFLRVFGILRLRRHREIEFGRASDPSPVQATEIRDVLRKVLHLAWRDGVVNLSGYVSSQGMSIMSSLYLGLSETGTYSVLLQLTTAMYSFAAAYPKSFLPVLQAASANDDRAAQTRIISSCSVVYLVVYVVVTAGVALVILPLLPYFKPDFRIDYPLFFGLSLYVMLLQQHQLFCCYIISMNEIPYMKGFLVAALLGLGFVGALCGVLGWGAWGIVLGQALSQLLYNNWKWPVYLCRKIGTTYRSLLKQGVTLWEDRIGGMLFAKPR